MKKRVVAMAIVAVIAAVIIGVTSCSTDSDAYEQISVVAMDDGVKVVETMSMDATVTAKDAANRKITLMSELGGAVTFKADPGMANFDQLTIGDKVHAVVTEEIVVYIGAGVPSSTIMDGGVMLAPEGAKPGGAFPESHQVTVTVAVVDARRRKISLKLPDGSTKEMKVSKEVNLSHVAVGDNLVAVVSEGVALEVITP